MICGREGVEPLVVRLGLFDQVEAVDMPPVLAQFHFQPETLLDRYQAEGLVGRLLLDVGTHLQRCRQREAAETDIGEIGRAADIHGQHHVADRPIGTLGVPPQHSRSKAADGKLQFAQNPHEHQVMFEAVAAAPVV
jgi:hypothetical protein